MINKMSCGCCRNIKGSIVDPHLLMKVISHAQRKKLLNQLFILTSESSVTKEQLAKATGMTYQQTNYQLNTHLKEFWKVKRREKIRGTYREFIVPKNEHAIYVNLGSKKTIYMIDPFSNLIGKLREVGTRCDGCSSEFIKWCNDEFFGQKNLRSHKGEKDKLERLLEDNGRKRPFTPIDYLLAFTIATSIDNQECLLELSKCKCQCSG